MECSLLEERVFIFWTWESFLFCPNLLISMFSDFWDWIFIGIIILQTFLYYLIDKYLIYPSSGDGRQ